MHNIMIFGAGKIGSVLSVMLHQIGGYKVYLADQDFGLFKRYVGDSYDEIQLIEQDIQDTELVKNNLKQYDISVCISALPFFLTLEVAKLAKESDVHYFDLTEDVAITSQLQELSNNANSAFVPQCGLAPGVVGLIANNLMKKFERVDEVKLRVGALPQFTSNLLKYSLTWSTDGLVNEYLNPCVAIIDGNLTNKLPLDDLETIVLDGVEYEAFNTSGGLGSLANLNVGFVKNMDYKSIRYPGHRDEMKKLIQQFDAKNDTQKLKDYLETNVPATQQDVVVLYVSVKGLQDGILKEDVFSTKIYPAKISSIEATAIQISTSAGMCGIVEQVLNTDGLKGFIHQETLSLQKFMASKFGKFY